MRIAQVSHGLDCGGSMALVVALSCELERRGHEVDVVCIDRATGSAHEALFTKQLAEHGIAVHFLGRKRGTAGAAAAAKLWSIIQQRKYEILHSHLPMPDAISGLLRRVSPHRFVHVVTVHNTYEPRSHALEVLGSGANVVYCSEAVGRRNPLPGTSSSVIPNGIPQRSGVVLIKPRSIMRREFGVDDEAKLVVGVGRLCAQKNFSVALESFAVLKKRGAVPNVHYVICGDGEDRKALEARVRELELESIVQFMGSRTDLPSVLQASEAFLSTSRHEGMPLAVLEALYAGLPCVLSDIPEHCELAQHMPGCIFVPQTPDAIAMGLESVLRAPSSLFELRMERETLLQKHSIERCAEAYDSLYRIRCGSKLSPHLAHP